MEKLLTLVVEDLNLNKLGLSNYDYFINEIYEIIKDDVTHKKIDREIYVNKDEFMDVISHHLSMYSFLKKNQL